MVREHLKPLKIDMTVQPTEAGTFATNNGMGNFDMQLTGRGFRHDPSGHFNEFNPASAVFPRWFGEGWKNDELTGLITAGLQTADVAKRHDIYFQIQRILLSELVHIPFNRDYPVVQATTLFVAAVFVIANLSVDLLYGYLDPRLKHT